MLKLLTKQLHNIKITRQNKIVQKIHNEFDSSCDKILAEAKEILEQEDNKKGQTLHSLGFIKSKPATDFRERQDKKVKSKELAKLIDNYKTFYPHNKFITKDVVEQICKKYNLVFAEVKYYIGDIPEKNVKEIELFKLRNEDMYKRTNVDDYNDDMRNLFRFSRSSKDIEYYESHLPKDLITRYIKPSFLICAPEKDFDKTNLTKKGFKLEFTPPDPVVLQPVKGGYLIVSKWGIEANDQLLVNEINN